MYVGRPSVSADSDRSSALIAQMQATAHAASFSSSHPGDNTTDTKHGTPSVLCAAAAYRHLQGDSICIFQCSLIFILPQGTSFFHHIPVPDSPHLQLRLHSHSRVFPHNPLVARTLLIMIVDNPARLQVRIYRNRTHILKPALLQVFTNSL